MDQRREGISFHLDWLVWRPTISLGEWPWELLHFFACNKNWWLIFMELFWCNAKIADSTFFLFQPMMLSDTELLKILFAKEILLLQRLSRIIIYLKNRNPQSDICRDYINFFELGHRILLNMISRWSRDYLS